MNKDQFAYLNENIEELRRMNWKLVEAMEKAASMIRTSQNLNDQLVEAHNILDKAATEARAACPVEDEV